MKRVKKQNKLNISISKKQRETEREKRKEKRKKGRIIVNWHLGAFCFLVSFLHFLDSNQMIQFP